MEKVHVIGEMRVTVDGPDAVVERIQSPVFSLYAVSDEAFEEVVAALGGPDHAHVSSGYSGDWAVHMRGTDSGAVVIVRRTEEDPPKPPKPRVIERLLAAKAAARPPVAVSGEQRAALADVQTGEEA